MRRRTADRLRAVVVTWTAITGIFAWLPLVRIMGRPEGYTWGILGLTGAGTEGPFWIFVPLTIWVLLMLFCALRGPRSVARPLIVAWHLLITGVVVIGVVQGGPGARLQGQGLHWAVPLWMLVVPFALLAALSIIWAFGDRSTDGGSSPPAWSRANSDRLAASLALLVVALVLFRAGTNYDWVTAAAIATTILHWTVLLRSFDAKAADPYQRSRAIPSSTS